MRLTRRSGFGRRSTAWSSSASLPTIAPDISAQDRVRVTLRLHGPSSDGRRCHFGRPSSSSRRSSMRTLSARHISSKRSLPIRSAYSRSSPAMIEPAGASAASPFVGPNDELCAPVARIRLALDYPSAFEVIYEFLHGGEGHRCGIGELGQPLSSAHHVREHVQVTRPDACQPGLVAQSCEQVLPEEPRHLDQELSDLAAIA